MSIQMACPGCGASYTLADELKGKKIRCKKCEEIFAVNGVAKRAVDEAVEPAEKVRTGPRAASPTVRRRGVDDEGAKRTAIRPAAKRLRGEDADDGAPEPAKKGAAAKPTGSKKPLLIGGAGLGVLLLVGGIVLAVVMLNKDDDKPTTKTSGTSQSSSSNQSTTQSSGKQEASVNPKKENKAGNTDSGFGNITEKVAHPESQKGKDPPDKIDVGSGLGLSPDVVDRVKKSTVYIEVEVEQGRASGSGWFGVERGIIITNAHVLGMLRQGSQPPASIKVVLNSGELQGELEVQGKDKVKILGVDSSADLAVLKIDVPPEKMPAPLKVVPTKPEDTVKTSQDVFVVGFPKGYQVNRAASVRRSNVSAWVHEGEPKELRRIQLEGGADPGNSGGPVININGDVVGVLVEGFGGTSICRAIPGDHVFRLLNGRVGTVTLREPYRPTTGARVMKLPVEVQLIDPMGRVKAVGIDYWRGAPGEPRLVATSQPEPVAADSQHKSETLTVDKDKHVAVGELTLEDKDDDQVYWQQAFCVNGSDAKQWSAGTVCNVVLPPAERRQGSLVVRHEKSKRTLELVSKATYRVFGADDDAHEQTYEIKTNLTETTTSVNKKGDQTVAQVALNYDKLEMKILVDKRPVSRTKSLEKSMQDAKYMRALLQINQWGDVLDTKTDVHLVPEISKRWLNVVGDQVEISMSTLAIPLPNDTRVQPLHQWGSVRELILDPAGRLQTGMLEMKYTYLGTRKRAGLEEAVIEMTGEVKPLGRGTGLPSSALRINRKAKGTARGNAIVDVKTGLVTWAQMTADVETEVSIQVGGDRGPALFGRAGGTLEVSLRRGSSVPVQ